MAMGNMDMMDMDMGSASLGGDITIINQAYARSYWYFVAAALVLFLIIRIINFVLYGSR